MYNSKKKPLEDVPTELTLIWSCTGDDCKGWMRDNFSFSATPKCPQCGSPMAKDSKMLDVVENTSPVISKRT